MGSGDESYDVRFERRRRIGKVVSVAVSLLFLGAMIYSFVEKVLH